MTPLFSLKSVARNIDSKYTQSIVQQHFVAVGSVDGTECTHCMFIVSKIRFAKNEDDVPSSTISVTKKEEYEKLTQVSQLDNVYDSVYTTQKNASTVQGQVYSDTDYYTSEGLVGGGNKPGSNPDPSIPTTENQAYTSVSADTERVRDEEIYDCV